MDSLTQIVLGAAVGELVLGRKVGNKAILWGAIAGTIPDLDVLNRYFFDDLRANELHRGVTHSFLFSMCLAPLLGIWIKRHQASLIAVFATLVMAVFFFGSETLAGKVVVAVMSMVIVVLVLKKAGGADKATSGEWGWLFWWSLVTHPILDCHTTWGTQLFWPLPIKIAFNNIFVVDPAYTLPFLVCMVFVLRLDRTDPRRSRINALGLILSTSYLALTFMFKYKAHTHISASLDRQGIDHGSLSTRPTPFNSILWTTNVDLGNEFGLGHHSLLDRKAEVDLVRIPKGHELLGNWRNDEKVRRLVRLSEGNFVIQQRNDTLVFCDLRFGQIGEPSIEKPFVYSYLLIPEGEGIRVVLVPPPRPDSAELRAMMGELWDRIQGE